MIQLNYIIKKKIIKSSKKIYRKNLFFYILKFLKFKKINLNYSFKKKIFFPFKKKNINNNNFFFLKKYFINNKLYFNFIKNIKKIYKNDLFKFIKKVKNIFYKTNILFFFLFFFKINIKKKKFLKFIKFNVKKNFPNFFFTNDLYDFINFLFFIKNIKLIILTKINNFNKIFFFNKILIIKFMTYRTL